MARQSGRRQCGMKGSKWTVVIKLQLLAILLGEVVALASAMSVGDNAVGYAKQGFGFRRMPYKSLSLSKQQQHQQQQQRRLKQTGNEIIPAVGSNDISDEPTCEELRAMWRYYKRQSRAELTNEIPQFGKNPFFEMLPNSPRNPVFASFGMGPKGRSKNRLRPQNHLYGRVVQKPSKPRERGGGRNQKPFEIVRDMMRNPSGSRNNAETSRQNNGAGEEIQVAAAMAAAAAMVTTTTPPSAIVHYSPPPHPPKESSFQKLKEIISNERMREKGTTLGSPSTSTDNREYGKIILSPPRGQDGRRINKPLERMTPFEKIRFGHADDLLDEGIRRNLDVMKRRTLPLSVLKTQWKQQQQQQQRQPLQKRRFLSNPMLFLTPSSSSGGGGGGGGGDRSTTFTSSNHFERQAEENNNNNNIIAQTNDKQQLDNLFENDKSQLHDDNLATLLANNENNNNNNNIIINNGDYTDSIIDEVPPSASAASAALSNYASNVRQTVEMPTCVEVEHQTCNQTVDCSCIGFALYRCYLNQCQILPLAYSVQEEPPSAEEELSSSSSDNSQPDIWHSEPLPSEKLGIWEDPIVVGVDDSAAARLSTIRARKSIQNEGKPNKSNARLTDTTYLVLQGQNLYT